MIRAVTFVAAALLLLPEVAAAQTSPSPAPSPVHQGSLDAQDPKHWTGGPFECLGFTAGAGGRFAGRLTATAFRPALAVHGGSHCDGKPLGGDEYGWHGDDQTANVTLTLPGPGEYSLLIRGRDSAAAGAYQLFAGDAPPLPAGPIASLRHGEVTGDLGETDPLNDGRRSDCYTFVAAADVEYDIEMLSKAFRPYLEVFPGAGCSDQSLSWLERGGSAGDAVSFRAPVGGAYSVRASSRARGATGPYTLTFNDPEPD